MSQRKKSKVQTWWAIKNRLGYYRMIHDGCALIPYGPVLWNRRLDAESDCLVDRGDLPVKVKLVEVPHGK